MKDLFETEHKKGTYAGVRYSTESNKALHQYMRDNKIPNAIRPDKLHTTLLYSRKHCPEYQPIGSMKQPWNVVPGKFTVWQTNEDSSKITNCLVLMLESDDMVNRHKHLIEEYGATHDYDEYNPHITLSYDIGDLDVATLPAVVDTIPQLTAIEEYMEELDLDWAAKKGAKQ